MPGLAGVDSSKGCQLARLVVMTNREIAFHLMLLVLLLLGGTGFYSYQKSPAMVPALIAYLDSDSLRERQAATARLQELGNRARESAPRLLALTSNLKSPDAQAATQALSRIDLPAARQAMDAARLGLDATDLNTRRRAAEILGGLGFLARPAVPNLAVAAQSDDGVVRDRSLSALGRIGIPVDQVLPALIRGLDDPVDHVRYVAVVAIESVPPALASEALPALQRLAADSQLGIGQRARHVLARLGERRDLTVELNVARYMVGRAGETESQLYTLHRLALLGPSAAPLLPELTTLFAAANDIVRLAAIETLAAIGPPAGSALPALRLLGDDRDPVIREAARYALARIGEAEAQR